MNATTYNKPNKVGVDQRYTLDLSFSEMHFIIEALSKYGHVHGYGLNNEPPVHVQHAIGAEALYSELIDIYATEPAVEELAPSMHPLFADILKPFGIK